MTIIDTSPETSQPGPYEWPRSPIQLDTERLSEHASFRTLAHFHEDVEFIRIRAGTMADEINGQDVLLTKGDVLFINSRHMHRNVAVGGNDCLFEIVQFHPSLLSGGTAEAQAQIFSTFNDQLFSHVHITRDDPTIDRWHLLFDLCFEGASPTAASGVHAPSLSPARELFLVGILYAMTSLLIGLHASTRRDVCATTGDRDLSLIRTMTDFVYRNYAQKIRVDDLAEAAFTSRSRCNRLFRRFTNLSPAAFVNRYRLQVGSRMLLETTQSIAAISQACGFSDQSYFTKAFQREFHLSPKDYRRRASKAVPPSP